MSVDPCESRPDAEIGLDPDDWDGLRSLGHRMVDDMMDYLATVDARPAWRPVPREVRDGLIEPVPREAQDPWRVYDTFRENILPYPLGNIHPRFWGWVSGTGTPLAMLAEMLASAMNVPVPGYDQSAALVEERVIAWLVELMGFPEGSRGLLLSGGSMANLVGIAVARSARAGFDVRDRGLHAPDVPPLVLYASSEVHTSVPRAVEVLGLGNRALRRIPVDTAYRIDLTQLERAITADRAGGARPFCVVGTAGTVNTGATDDLEALARICRREGLWFHVDGAFGALAALVPSLQPVVAGMEHADSLAFDLHKWGYLPYESGCTLVRDGAAHRAAFAVSASYLESGRRGVLAGGLPFADLGIQLSRGFRALKVWMSFKTHGIDAIARVIEQNVAQARYLCGLIESHPCLELAAPAPLNVVCFRFVKAGTDEASLDALNKEILYRVQESGEAVPSSTHLAGRFVLRVAITNHRSRRSDFDRLVSAVTRAGEEALAGSP